MTSIGGEKRSDCVSVKKDLCQLKQCMVEDIEFVTKSGNYFNIKRVKQGLFQDLAQEGAKCIVANFKRGANKNPGGLPHTKYRIS